MTAYAIQRYRKSCFSCLYWNNDSCMFSSCIFIIITCIHFFAFLQNWSIIVDLNCGYIKQIYFSFWFILISKKWNRQSTVSLCAKLLIFLTVQQAKSFSFEMNPTVTRWGKLLSSKTALSLFCARIQKWPYLDLTLYNLEMVLLLKFESKLVKRGWIKERKAHCYWVQQISI